MAARRHRHGLPSPRTRIRWSRLPAPDAAGSGRRAGRRPRSVAAASRTGAPFTWTPPCSTSRRASPRDAAAPVADEERHDVDGLVALGPGGGRDLARRGRRASAASASIGSPPKRISLTRVDPLGRAPAVGPLRDRRGPARAGRAAALRGGRVLGLELLDPAPVEEGEPAQVDADVAVVGVDPVLVEAVRRGQGRVEPDRVAGLALAELRARRREQERVGQAVGGLGLAVRPAGRPPDQLEAGGDVAPLVGAAALQLDAVRATEVGEVGRLEEHVAELGEREPLARRAWTESLSSMYGIVKCFPTSRRKSRSRTSPSQSRLFTTSACAGPGCEVEVARELVPDGVDVRLDGRPIEERPLAGAARRVADHPGRAADEGDRLAAGPLEAHEARRSAPGARRGASGRSGRSRCRRGSARSWRGGPRGPPVTSWTRPRQRRSAEEPGEARRAHGVTAPGSHASKQPGGTEREFMTSMLS